MNPFHRPDRLSIDLASMLWGEHIEYGLTVCSFVKRTRLFKYAGKMGENNLWKLRFLNKREDVIASVLRAKINANGSYVLALVKPGSKIALSRDKCLLCDEDLFDSCVKLIDFIDGEWVVHDDIPRLVQRRARGQV